MNIFFECINKFFGKANEFSVAVALTVVAVRVTLDHFVAAVTVLLLHLLAHLLG